MTISANTTDPLIDFFVPTTAEIFAVDHSHGECESAGDGASELELNETPSPPGTNGEVLHPTVAQFGADGTTGLESPSGLASPSEMASAAHSTSATTPAAQPQDGVRTTDLASLPPAPDEAPARAPATAINAQEGAAGQPGGDFQTEKGAHQKRLAEWEQCYRAIQERICTVLIELNAAKDRAKHLNKLLKELGEEAAAVKAQRPEEEGEEGSSGVVRTHSLDDVRTSDCRTDENPVRTNLASEVRTTTATPLADPNAWRSTPLSALSLKPSVETKLLENDISTIGQLEDLRAKGCGPGMGLRSIKGVGEKKADEIEEAVLEWLTKNRDSQVFNQHDSVAGIERPEPAAGGVTIQQKGQPLAPQWVNAAAPSNGNAPPVAAVSVGTTLSSAYPAGIAAHDPDAIRAATIEARAAELIQSAAATGDRNDSSYEAALTQQCDQARWWNGGVEGFDRGWPVIDCPIDPAGAERDDWIRGWLTAQLFAAETTAEMSTVANGTETSQEVASL